MTSPLSLIGEEAVAWAPSEEATSDHWSLVNRLRRAAAPRHDPLQETDLYTEAAAEIERLSTALPPADLAAAHCPPDLVEYGRRNGIPEFAQYTWQAGFIDGWRAFSTALLNPSEEVVEVAARALCEARGWNPDAFHPPGGDPMVAVPDHAIPLWVQMRKEVRAALRAAAMKITGRQTE